MLITFNCYGIEFIHHEFFYPTETMHSAENQTHDNPALQTTNNSANHYIPIQKLAALYEIELKNAPVRNHQAETIDATRQETIAGDTQNIFLHDNTTAEEIAHSQEESGAFTHQKFDETLKNQPQMVFDSSSSKSSLNFNLSKKMTSKVKGKFIDFLCDNILLLLKTNFSVSINTNTNQISLKQIVIESVKALIFQLSNIPEKMINQEVNNNTKIFKMQLQYLSEQIQDYNEIRIYTNPEEMLLLIQCINQFLKENHIISFSEKMYENLNEVSTIASRTCNLFKNENIVFTSNDVPTKILNFFKTAINNTNKLPNANVPYDVMHAMYDTHGYIEQIIQTWQAFQKHELYTTPINSHYGAFLTFLLLFENSIVAAANILDETSSRYHITNPVPVVINI